MKIKPEGQKGPEVRTSEAMNKKLFKKYFSLTFPLIIDGIIYLCQKQRQESIICQINDPILS